MNITILKEEEYRSKPGINMPCDMVRATITVPRWKWQQFKKELEKQEKRERVIAEIFDLDLHHD